MHLHLSSRVPLVDHTTGESLRYFLEEFSGQDQSPTLVIEGWDHMRPLSKHETSTRIADSLFSQQPSGPGAMRPGRQARRGAGRGTSGRRAAPLEACRWQRPGRPMCHQLSR